MMTHSGRGPIVALENNGPPLWGNLTPNCEIPQSADTGLAATPGVRSMAPSKRRKTSAVSQPASGNASAGVRTRVRVRV